MSDQKKPTDSGSTESAATEEPGKELDADQLENVAGGLLPARRGLSMAKVDLEWDPIKK